MGRNYLPWEETFCQGAKPRNKSTSALSHLTVFVSGSSTCQGAQGPEQGPDHADAPARVQLGLPCRRIRIHISPELAGDVGSVL
jgi:hypothetical protein